MGDVSYFVVDFGYLIIWNYFEMFYVKGFQDGVGVNLKFKVDMVVIR